MTMTDIKSVNDDSFDEIEFNDKEEHVEDSNLGRVAVIDVWKVLYSEVLKPVAIRGYADVAECIRDDVPIKEVRNELKNSSILIIVTEECIDSKMNITEDYVNSSIEDMNEALQSRTVELEDYEKPALCALIFKQIGRWENKVKLLEALLVHFKLEDRYKFESKAKILFDSEKVDLRVISSIADFTKSLESAIGDRRNPVYFRGHNRVSYKLLPSLFRNEKFYQNERGLYLDLLSSCPQEFMSLRSHIDILAEMQHYGLPTRLLDVTSNALTAMYFACEDEGITSKTGEVIMLEIESERSKYYQDLETVMLSSLPLLDHSEKQYLYDYARNNIKTTAGDKAFEKLKAEVRTERSYSSMREHLTDILEFYLVSPQKLNRRIMNQDGAFILCGLLDEIYSSNPFDGTNEKKYIFLENLRVKEKGKKAVLIVRNKEYIMKQLKIYGINRTRIYPEIDQVAGYIKNSIGSN